jgi:hypothetical protein
MKAPVCRQAERNWRAAITCADTITPNAPETPFLGLAPFLRMSIAGQDLRSKASDLLAMADGDCADANLWMNISTAMLCLGVRDVGLAMQTQALALQQIYHRRAARQPASRHVLMLMVPGDIAANTPLDCLLEDSDVDLDYYYVLDGDVRIEDVPEHDAVVVAICESDENRATLAKLADSLVGWPKPIINAPEHIPATGRVTASEILQDVPGLLIPPTLRVSRATLMAIADGSSHLREQFLDCDFPIILRPVGSHGGHGLDKLNGSEAIATYLAGVAEEEFFLSPFIDYSGGDGLFRKSRIALIDGVPFACHQAISAHWMIHYVNAGMYEDAWKRAEEAMFMAHFAEFALRHGPALEAIYRRAKLDYVCIDCAETPDGRLLIFEIDHAMVVHNMDSSELFPYKHLQMQQVSNAFRDFLMRLTAGPSTGVRA